MKKLVILLFLGFLLRLLLVPQFGFEADVAYWKTWSLAASDKGIVWLTQNTNYNYPAGYALVLWLIGKTYRLFADPNNFDQYWQAGNFLYLFLCKLPAIISDLAIAWGIYFLIKHQKLLELPKESSKLALILAGLYLFHPVVLFDGAWWGQVDAVGVVFVLFSLIFLYQRKPLRASILITAGFLFKLQTMIFLPLFFLYIWRRFSWQEMVKSLGAATITFMVFTFPFWLGRAFSRTFYLIYQNADWFPLLSLRADNLWWIVSRGAGMKVSDKILVFGITSAKTAGLILFSTFYFLAAGLVFVKPKPRNLLFALTFAAFAFFLFPTQSHERYIFPAFILFFLFIPIFEKKRNLILILFGLLSLTILINLNNSMILNYPQNGISFLRFLVYPSIDIFISFFNLAVFLIFLVFILKKLPVFWGAASGLILFAGFFLTNFSYLVSNKVVLTKFKPITFEQDYGTPQTNLGVSSMFGPKSWSFLSNNYFFYRQGIGTHANSRIVFDIGGKFRKFTTDFGVDTAGGENASVIFEIYGDSQRLFTSGKMTKADFPKHAEVQIVGVKNLILIVNDAGDGIYGDHADWFAPILYKT